MVSGTFNTLVNKSRQIAGATNGPLLEVAKANPGILHLLLFFCAYMLVAQVGQGLAIVPGVDIAVWPPAGLVVGALLLSKVPSWPWWLAIATVGEFTANALWIHNPLGITILYAIANILEVLTAAWLLRRFTGSSSRFGTLWDTLLFAVIAAGIAPAVGATITAGANALAAPEERFLETWALAWLGDSTGILAVTPLMILASAMWKARRQVAWPQLLEPALLIVAMQIILVIALHSSQHIAYAILPLLVWLAVRTQFGGVVVAILLLTITSSFFTSQRLGLFAGDSEILKLRIVLLQSFLGISALISLLVAALAQQYNETLSNLKEANRRLEGSVAQRTARLQQSEDKLDMALEAAGSGTWSLDGRTGHMAWDARFHESHGMRPDDPITFETWTQAISPLDREHFLTQLETLRAAPGTERWETEYRVEHRGLGQRWLLSIGRAEYEHGGEFGSLAGISLDITYRKTHEERLRMLMRESNHRKKNLLAVVMAIARHTVSHQPEDFLQRLQARIHSLAANYDLLINNAWQGVDLEQIIHLQLAHFKDLVGKRIFASGPQVRINATGAQPIGMAIHELSTNAGKYGALSTQDGTIRITWKITKHPRASAGTFWLAWEEDGGPPVSKPKRKGFGSAVTKKMIEMSLGGEVQVKFDRQGLSWTLTCPACNVVEIDNSFQVN